MKKYFEDYSIPRYWYDAIADKVEHKIFDCVDGSIGAEYEYFAFRRESVRAGYMEPVDLPVVDYVEHINNTRDPILEPVTLPIVLNGKDFSEKLETIREAIDNAEWLADKLKEYANALDALFTRVCEEDELLSK